MRIGVITAVEPLGDGLHRILASGIEAALIEQGHQVECVLLPFCGSRDVLEQVWAIRTLHLSDAFDRVVTLRPPAHLVLHPHKVALLSCHADYGLGYPDAIVQRLSAADRAGLSAADRVFATSAAAADYWRKRAGVRATVLPPPGLDPTTEAKPPEITAAHIGPATPGCMLPALLDALRYVSPAVCVQLSGGAAQSLLSEELGLRAARLRPGSLTIGGPGQPAHAHICLAVDDDHAIPAMDRAAAAGRIAIVNRACPASLARAEADEGAIAVAVDDPRDVAAALDRVAAEPAWAAWQGVAGRKSLGVRPAWKDVAWAVTNP